MGAWMPTNNGLDSHFTSSRGLGLLAITPTREYATARSVERLRLGESCVRSFRISKLPHG